MAPEVMEGQSYSGKVDVYAFGIVLCEIFSRIVPFSGEFSVVYSVSRTVPSFTKVSTRRFVPAV